MAGSGREVRGSVSSCGEDLEKTFGRGSLNWGIKMTRFVREAISYDFLTEADKSRGRR